MSWHGGKGDMPRKVDRDRFNAEFDRIFKNGKDNDKDSRKAASGSDDADAKVRQAKAVRE